MRKKFQGIEPQIHSSTFVADSAVVIGKVNVGKDSSIWDCAVIRGDVDTISIGDESNIQDGSVLHVDQQIPLKVGNGVTIGHGVNLHGCTIGDNTLIGIGAIILNGAVIGKNCIVAAGSLVTPNTNIPENSMVMGAPGRVIREVKDNELEANKKNAEVYCKLAKEYMK